MGFEIFASFERFDMIERRPLSTMDELFEKWVAFDADCTFGEFVEAYMYVNHPSA